MTTATIPNYLDVSLPVADRIADLLGRMTVEEKIGQMLQLDARDELEDQVVRMHAGSILHASPEKVLRARAMKKKGMNVNDTVTVVRTDPKTQENA